MRTTRTSLRSAALAASAILVALAAAEVQARSLTLDERVAAQQAIEQVYWSHRIWPDVNPQPKPAFATESTEPAVRAKVARSLSLSFSVEAARHAPLTGEELQEEIERMAAETKAPHTLRELFAALGNDPFLVAECLARPALVSRVALAAGIQADGQERELMELDHAAVEPPVAGYVLPAIPGGGCANDSWALSSLTGGTGTRVPSARQLHTAVWTGAELVVWGGWDGGTAAFIDGGLYDPATDTWLVSALTSPSGDANVPSARYRHTAVWTGSEMIIWGGRNAAGTALDNGGRYNPTTDSWVPSSLVTGTGTNVPDARQFHTAVWTGSTMIVWGGTPDTPGNALDTGGVFDPTTDGWTDSSLTAGTGANVPAARIDHTAVWSDTAAPPTMIVWGGRGTADLANGGKYDPAADAWLNSVLTTGSGTLVPSARHDHTAVWTGADMIVWGGASGTSSVNTGGRYNVATDAWRSSSLTNGTGTRVPTARQLHTAIWTGSEMIVWGGSTDGTSGTLNTGGRYSPGVDGWAVSSLTNATGVRVPTPRQNHTLIWTGAFDQMIVWGGSSGTPTGGVYCAVCPIVVWHNDADGDGFGDPAVTIPSCSQPAGYVAPSGDCDDTNSALNPDATEACDGLDNDCDTVTDNGGDALCADADACSADFCQGTGGCAAPPRTANLDVSGFSLDRVDGRDLVILADAWNACPGDPRYAAAANLDQGTAVPASCVDMADFHLFMNSFGLTCSGGATQ